MSCSFDSGFVSVAMLPGTENIESMVFQSRYFPLRWAAVNKPPLAAKPIRRCAGGSVSAAVKLTMPLVEMLFCGLTKRPFSLRRDTNSRPLATPLS